MTYLLVIKLIFVFHDFLIFRQIAYWHYLYLLILNWRNYRILLQWYEGFVLCTAVVDVVLVNEMPFLKGVIFKM